MQNNRREASLELEIQSLLCLHSSASEAVEALLKKYDSQKLNVSQLEIISTFCLHAGLPVPLLAFFCKQIQNDNVIPWGHFVEALAMSQERIEAEVYSAVIEGARAQKMGGHLSRSHALDEFDPQIDQDRELRRRSQNEKVLQLKRELLNQVEMYRSQELENEEGRALEKLMGLFPKDPQIHQQYAEHRSRKALRLLESKMANPVERNWQEAEPRPDAADLQILQAIESSMQAVWEQEGRDAQLGMDFAVAHFMWENPEAALGFVPEDSEPISALWLRTEALLRTRRFIELLALLENMEARWSNDPEITFAASYLRAQAYWGLGRKFEAIDILEGLVNVRPNYRSAAAILIMWRGRDG